MMLYKNDQSINQSISVCCRGKKACGSTDNNPSLQYDNPLLQPTDSFLYLTLGQALQCFVQFPNFWKETKDYSDLFCAVIVREKQGYGSVLRVCDTCT